MTGTPIRRWVIALLFVLTLSLLAIGGASDAHEKKKHQQAAQVQLQQQQSSHSAQTSAAIRTGPTAEHGQMGEMMGDMREDRTNMSYLERLLDWLGRTHPVIVHFPIAFFPAALFTAIVGRRRPAFAAPVQFLVVAGGIIAPIAAVFGWLDAVSAGPDPLLTVHRWLGSAIGIAALMLGIWAWRRPDGTRSTGMIVALSAITAAIVLQGWYGGALVHGIDHMNW